MISTVVLAGRRLWQPAEKKPPAPPKGNSTLQSVLENVLASDIDEVICVADDLAAARREVKLADARLIWHLDTAAAQGQSAAVIAGLWASHPESDGIMFVAAELPSFRREVIDWVIGRFENSQAWIVAAMTGDQKPNPIMFRRELYPELLKLTGDDTGGSLLDKHFETTVLVEWQEEDCLPSEDQRQAQARLKESV